MSTLEIKYNRGKKGLRFKERKLDHRYCDIAIQLDNGSKERLKLNNLKYTLVVRDGSDVLGTLVYPSEGVKMIESDQKHLTSLRVYWDPDREIDITVSRKLRGVTTRETHQLTTPSAPEEEE